jgi:hypothetical protein
LVDSIVHGDTTAPSKASAQTRAIVAAMGEAAATAETLKQLQSSPDLLHGVVAGVDTAQQQMRAQLDHQAAAIESSATKHDDTTRILQALMAQLKIGETGVADKSPPADEEPDPGEMLNSGTSHLFHTKAKWTANTAGASSSAGATEAERGSEGFLASGGGGGTGGAGGGRSGGAGGGEFGGAGGSQLGGAGGGEFVGVGVS